MERENEIRLIAYKLWQDEGCKDGHDCEHWLKAEAVWEENHKKPVAVAATEPVKKTTPIPVHTPNKHHH
ncbi:MAG TPA: DUF2934 domain-containing protein [Dehalococcoidales bacterium]|nr:DUF2934 domain-containing protein [Dehalococcoidales bacterium]